MTGNNEQKVGITFQSLRAKEETLFDRGSLKYSFDREGLFMDKYEVFIKELESEIKNLSEIPIIWNEIDSWVKALEERIDKSVKKGKLSEIGTIFLSYRKKLKYTLIQIKKEQLTINKQLTTQPATVDNNKPCTFKEIFVSPNWKLYTDALYQVDNPVISSEYEFTGKSQKHKGVICSWIKELQTKGIINGKYNRQQLAAVLNHEIKGLELGKDGKTFDNISVVYENDYKKALLKLVNLLP